MALLDEENEDRPGVPSNYVCPECGGTLYEISEGDVLRFRCHVGHAYSAETYLAEQNDGVEAALWVALRVLEDNMSLTRRMAERARAFNRTLAAERFEARAHNVAEQAQVVRNVLMNGLRPLRDSSAASDEPADTGTAGN